MTGTRGQGNQGRGYDTGMKTTPMEHQQRALDFLKDRAYGALFMDPGLGKTKVIVDDVVRLATTGSIDTVVVICPKSITSVWVEEIATHSDDQQVHAWGGKAFEKVTSGKGAIWWIINIDAVNKTKTSHLGYDMVQHILSQTDKAMVVVDESTIIKNADAKRTKAVTTIGVRAKYRRILTGTPVANTPLDIYAQMRFLSPHIFKYSKNFFAFRARYAVMGGFQMRQVVGYKNQDDLAAIVGLHAFRASKDMCLDLPERTTQIREVELSNDTWRAYRAFVDELAVELADTPMAIDMVIKKIVKLRQLTGGWVKHDDGEVHHVGNEKLRELEHLLDECKGQKVIIWCQFVHEIQALHDKYPESRVYYGAMNSKARDEARHAFENGPCPMIIIQNDTGSMGLTLNAATVSIFYSNPIYPLPKDQARERNHRKGQTKPVTEYELIVRGSIDETIYNAWTNKRSLASVLMGVVEGTNRPDELRKFMSPMKTVNWKAPRKGKEH